jgi:hypothetical protein
MYAFALAAVATALYFAAAAWQQPRPAEILALILWAAYSVYEYLVANGTLCDANCNIRVDLLLFIPVLLSATYFALQKEPRTGAVVILGAICLVIVALLAAAFGFVTVAAIASVGALILDVHSIKSSFMNRT